MFFRKKPIVEDEASTDSSRGWEGAKTPVRGKRKKWVPFENVDAARRLSEHLDTSVKVFAGRRRGRIVIDFADGEDLKRVISQVFSDSNGTEQYGKNF